MNALIAAVLLFVPLSALPQTQAGGWRWERVLVPLAAAPTAEQCAVVDADLYAHAAPGLRDVRLVQDGRDLPYAMDVSFDTRVGETVPPPADDRAQYEVVKTIPLTSASPMLRDSGAPVKPEVYFSETLLSAHVPVERIRLEPVPVSPTEFHLRAAARMNLQQAEELHAVLDGNHPVANFTLGANLQDEADVRVQLAGTGRFLPERVVLEMRRREICYQPRSASPIHLMFGDAHASLDRYDYALHFQPKAQPLLATMGPMVANPAYAAPQPSVPPMRVTPGLRLGVMLVIALGSLAATAFAIFELRRR